MALALSNLVLGSPRQIEKEKEVEKRERKRLAPVPQKQNPNKPNCISSEECCTFAANHSSPFPHNSDTDTTC